MPLDAIRPYDYDLFGTPRPEQYESIMKIVNKLPEDQRTETNINSLLTDTEQRTKKYYEYHVRPWRQGFPLSNTENIQRALYDRKMLAEREREWNEEKHIEGDQMRDPERQASLDEQLRKDQYLIDNRARLEKDDIDGKRILAERFQNELDKSERLKLADIAYQNKQKQTEQDKLDAISKQKQTEQDKLDVINEQKKYKQRDAAYANVKRSVSAFKVAMFVVLVILVVVSGVNANTSFITNDPGHFWSETITAGFGASIVTGAMAINRLVDMSMILKAMVVAFFLFFILYIMIELSGLNGSSTHSDASNQATIDHNVGITRIVLSVVIGLASMPIVWAAVHSTDFKSIHKYRYLSEIVLIGATSALVAYRSEKDRGHTDNEMNMNIGKALIMSMFMYTGLQTSGVFNYMIGDMPETISIKQYYFGSSKN